MRANVRNGLVLGAAVGLGAYAWWRWYAAQQRRAEMIEGGELRELIEVWTAVDGCRCYARVNATGASPHPPVVLLHGFGVSSSYFVPTAERLAREFDVYAPDLPGHGRSDTPGFPLDMRGFAHALHQWMNAMQLDRVVLVGNSMGCQVATEFAVRHPDRVERLVLIGPTMDHETRSVLRVLPRFVHAGLYERPPLLALLARDYLRMANRAQAELQAMVSDRIESKLARINHPVLFVRGANDPIAPARWIRELAGVTRNSSIAEIAAGGHAVNYSDADELVETISPFLRGDEVDLESIARGTALADSRMHSQMPLA